jgi:hypothetical protein
MGKSSVSSPVASGSLVYLNYFSYIWSVALLGASKENVGYNFFDSNCINGSESMGTLPVLDEYISVLHQNWLLLIRLRELIARDVDEINKKAMEFMKLDKKLAKS